MREIRLLPILLVAASSLLALKALGLVAGQPRAGQAQMQAVQTQNEEAADPVITGATPAKASEPPKPEPPKPEPNGRPQHPAAAQAPPPPAITTVVPTQPDQAALPPGERAVLQKLQERRQELEARARELDMREGLLRAAEKRLEARMQELRDLEGQAGTAATRREEAESQRIKGVVTMYETMRAKDAARIFDRLEIRLLVEIAAAMKPAKLADVLAQMSAEAAERLTVELASRGRGGAPGQNAMPAGELPKIEGRRS